MMQALLLTHRERNGHVSELEPLIERLMAGGHLGVTTTTSVERLSALDSYDVVIADVAAGALSEAQAEALRDFVWRGGGLICLGLTATLWREQECIRDLLGTDPGTRRTPPTELIVRIAVEHDITRRLDESFAVADASTLLASVPDDAIPLLRGTWRFTPLPLAYVRPYGEGQVFFTSLGESAETVRHPVFGQLLYRAVRYLGGWREPAPMRVAMVGYGAIGFEHGEALTHTPGLEFALVCDRSAARLEAVRQAFPGVRTVEELSEVVDDDGIDAVIVCTPPNTHAAVAQTMLEAGKHVVVEKPFCITTAEANALLAVAQERGRALTVYQNRRWDPDFLAIREVLREQVIGDVFHVETFIGGFSHPCDFWHSHEPISGGVFYDWGSHYLDWVLTLLPGKVASVRASAQKRVWHDVTNADQSNLLIRFRDGAEATFIHSDVAALLKPKWYLLGTCGAILGEWRHESVKSRKWSGDLIEERLAPAEALPTLTVAIRGSAGRIHHQQLELPPAPRHPFHRNLADSLLAGEPLAVPPEAARRNIAVMEAAAASAARDAEVIRIADEYA